MPGFVSTSGTLRATRVVGPGRQIGPIAMLVGRPAKTVLRPHGGLGGVSCAASSTNAVVGPPNRLRASPLAAFHRVRPPHRERSPHRARPLRRCVPGSVSSAAPGPPRAPRRPRHRTHPHGIGSSTWPRSSTSHGWSARHGVIHAARCHPRRTGSFASRRVVRTALAHLHDTGPSTQ
jgi:hypothetical protein